MARLELLGSRKFKRLSRALDSIAYQETRVRGFGQSLAAGSLELMWSSCYAALDDVLGTPEDVEVAASWNGEEGVLFAALRDAGLPDRVGFIEECPDRPGVWRVHDLWDHAPDFVGRQLRRKIEREQNGETISQLRAAAGRKGGLARAANLQANGKQMAGTCLANVATHDVKGEEKRGEKPCVEPEAAPAPTPLALVAPEPSASPSDRVFEVWERVCVPAGYATARRSKPQVEKARTRLKDPVWFDAFEAACLFLAGSAFHRGENDRGWSATLGWLLKSPDKAPELAERAATRRACNPKDTAHDAELRRALANAESDYRAGKYARPADDPGGCGAGGAGGSGESDPAANDVAAVGTSLSAAIGAAVVPRR